MSDQDRYGIILVLIAMAYLIYPAGALLCMLLEFFDRRRQKAGNGRGALTATQDRKLPQGGSGTSRNSRNP